MARQTGRFHTTTTHDERVRAFVPHPLPPRDPPLGLKGEQAELLSAATSALSRLEVAGVLVPSVDWFLYGFVRKEAVLSSQIEGTQATLRDVLTFEATRESNRPEDVEEVCNYVDALTYARREIRRRRGLPLSTRLLCQAHKRLMRGVRGAEKSPGELRTSQNWIGGSRPGNAQYVPPPPAEVPAAMSALERWIHAKDPLPPLVRTGLAHVQFESIHDRCHSIAGPSAGASDRYLVAGDEIAGNNETHGLQSHQCAMRRRRPTGDHREEARPRLCVS